MASVNPLLNQMSFEKFENSLVDRVIGIPVATIIYLSCLSFSCVFVFLDDWLRILTAQILTWKLEEPFQWHDLIRRYYEVLCWIWANSHSN